MGKMQDAIVIFKMQHAGCSLLLLLLLFKLHGKLQATATQQHTPHTTHNSTAHTQHITHVHPHHNNTNMPNAQ
jgi:hypothetical protein